MIQFACSERVLATMLGIVCLTLVMPFCGDTRARSARMPDVKKIRLDLGFTTSGQKGLNYAFSIREEKSRDILRQLVQDAKRNGASNVFLVAGDQIENVLSATSEVMCRGLGTDNVLLVNDQPGKAARYWLVAFFGVHSGDSGWRVKSIERQDKKIRIRFSFSGGLNLDRQAYFFWIPLDELDPGRYSLELYDDDCGDTNLIRRVNVPAK